MRKAVAGMILAILVAAGLGIGYLAESPGRQAVSSTSTTTQENPFISSATSTVSSTGLELRIDINSTQIQTGGTLAANVTLFNTLNGSLSLGLSELAASPISSWDDHDFICGASGVLGMASFAVLQGHYSARNLSQAPVPLQVGAIADLPCLSFLLSNGEIVTFSPRSSDVQVPGAGPVQATLNVTTVSCIALPPGSSQCHGGTGLFGYWSAAAGAICCTGSSDNSQYFRYFTPGAYTLVAEDAWNQTAYAYFRVTQGPSPAVVSAEESPFSSPGAPVIGLTLANFGDVPITSLNATVRFAPPPGSSANSASYPYVFNVNASSPLLPGQTVNNVETLPGALFDMGVSYPLTISGTLANGTDFTYARQVQFVNEAPSW